MAKRGRKAKNKGGRPVELTPAVLQRICNEVSKGNYIETAADLEGASIYSVRELLREGAREHRKAAGARRPVEPKLERAVKFALAMRKARAQAEKDDLEVIRKAGDAGQWTARAWRLERRQPDRWGRRERHDHRHSGPRGGAIPVVGTQLDPEKLKTLSDQELDVLERVITKLGAAGADPGGESSTGG